MGIRPRKKFKEIFERRKEVEIERRKHRGLLLLLH